MSVPPGPVFYPDYRWVRNLGELVYAKMKCRPCRVETSTMDYGCTTIVACEGPNGEVCQVKVNTREVLYSGEQSMDEAVAIIAEVFDREYRERG